MEFNAKGNAEGFANAFDLLFSKTSLSSLLESKSSEDAKMIFPTIVNGVFACEMFLKNLIGKEIHQHELKKLIKELDKIHPGYEALLKTITIKLYKKSKNQNYTDLDYDKDLTAFNNSFVNVRYWNEFTKIKSEIKYNMDFLQSFIYALRILSNQDIMNKEQTKEMIQVLRGENEYIV